VIGREQLVDVLDRAAADQRDRAAGCRAQPFQQVQQIGPDAHFLRSRREIEQRAVDVEEKSPIRRERRHAAHRHARRRSMRRISGT
jgi:hypothetical protein